MRELAKAAQRRLYPSLADPSYLTLRSRRLIFSAWTRQFRDKNLTVLDVGGRYQPYRPLLGDRVKNYLAVDLIRTEFVNAIADAEALPFAPATFDLVVATQVFEYVRDPRQALRQIHAALKPGGIVLASFAACAPRFGEDERWRFTAAGIRSLLEPFASADVIPELYSLASLIRTVNLGLDSFAHYDGLRRLYRVTGCPLLNLAGLVAENLKLTSNDQFTANYSVRAVKAA
ncbi:MAG TPA: class I SAM-dependent methyltransferase [Verrucomicrobiae bacterium]|nr:class I SAM-dependent methyltransferase [Verrucomicrobiae bacterium]